MTLREKLQALLKEAADIVAKAAEEDREFTEDEVTRINELKAETDEVGAKVKAADDAQALAAEHAGRGKNHHAKGGQPDALTKAFTDVVTQRGMVEGAKSLLPVSGSVMLPVDIGTVVLPYAANGLAQVISTAELAATDGFTYMQQTARTHNAATVARGTQKPTSAYTLGRVPGKVMTLAHLSEEIPKQWLADMPALEDFLRSEMTVGLQLEAHSVILNGGTAEDGSTVNGLLATTGVRTQAYTTNPLITTRKILTTMQLAGEKPTAWVFNPTDWETIELLRNEQDEPELSGTPTGRAPLQLWGLPVVLDPGIAAGTGLVGDWATVVLLTRQGVRMDWSEAGALFEKNQVKFRAEARIGIAFKRPGAVATVDLTE
ncbi:phage major capsid protein [Streptomyces sp. J2-1]|uniref:phage major capsid protein n=1 Tax=Streptomyces corallincola TaxID=2851888 RepID=UPI001C381299|nr:phage major capsid protein [Streptomyces corallincola]MBV2357817.1 phage major capsid protein [Streptomyces corallincola]